MDGFDMLSKHAVAKTTTGQVFGEGEVIIYCDAPTVVIQRPDGTRFSWRADLCDLLAPPPAANTEEPHE